MTGLRKLLEVTDADPRAMPMIEALTSALAVGLATARDIGLIEFPGKPSDRDANHFNIAEIEEKLCIVVDSACARFLTLMPKGPI